MVQFQSSFNNPAGIKGGIYSKTCVNGRSQKDQKVVFKTNYHLMQVKSTVKLVISPPINRQTGIPPSFPYVPISLMQNFLVKAPTLLNAIATHFKVQTYTFMHKFFRNLCHVA